MIAHISRRFRISGPVGNCSRHITLNFYLRRSNFYLRNSLEIHVADKRSYTLLLFITAHTFSWDYSSSISCLRYWEYSFKLPCCKQTPHEVDWYNFQSFSWRFYEFLLQNENCCIYRHIQGYGKYRCICKLMAPMALKNNRAYARISLTVKRA